ncbi:Ribosomal large subunit pseudouridine synthase D [Minicystis rosea]|nr:Ribosomal large subunit pseudouridine synthase D [Minicystis rosea]
MTREAFQTHKFTVTPDDQGKRLDQILAAHVPGLSRRKARVLLDLGGVFVDGARTKVAGKMLRRGQVVTANVGGALERASGEVGRAARARDEAALPAFTIVHQDADLVIVDKPAGLLTAPTPEGDRGNLAKLLEEKVGAPIFVVHRIDLETSGLLVLARTADANRILSERFRVHDVERLYLAALRGVLAEDERTVDAPVAGKRAVTHVKVIERFAAATLVQCRLETGRTHQIRLHTRHLGHPVLGDRKHGEPSPVDPPRMALHAAVLGIRQPRTGEALRFESAWPQDLTAWLSGLRGSAT